MNNGNGGMGSTYGWSGGETWIWPVIGVLVAVLLVVLIIKVATK